MSSPEKPSLEADSQPVFLLNGVVTTRGAIRWEEDAKWVEQRRRPFLQGPEGTDAVDEKEREEKVASPPPPSPASPDENVSLLQETLDRNARIASALNSFALRSQNRCDGVVTLTVFPQDNYEVVRCPRCHFVATLWTIDGVRMNPFAALLHPARNRCFDWETAVNEWDAVDN